MASQRNFRLAGAAISIIFLIRLLNLVGVGVIESRTIIELTNWGALAYMAFVIAYLYPQFKDNDERTKLIRQKGMYYSIFVVFIALIIFGLLGQFNILTITSLELIRLLLSITIVSIWTSWMILSKKY